MNSSICRRYVQGSQRSLKDNLENPPKETACARITSESLNMFLMSGLPLSWKPGNVREFCKGEGKGTISERGQRICVVWIFELA